MAKLLSLYILAVMMTVSLAQAATSGATIFSLASGNAEFSTVVSLIKRAWLEQTLNETWAFTVFAPINSAFEKIDAQTLAFLTSDAWSWALTQILLYHVVQGEIVSSSLKSGDVAQTIQGESVTVSISGTDVRLNTTTRVVIADIDASNGVIHAIDSVLLPSSIIALLTQTGTKQTETNAETGIITQWTGSVETGTNNGSDAANMTGALVTGDIVLGTGGLNIGTGEMPVWTENTWAMAISGTRVTGGILLRDMQQAVSFIASKGITKFSTVETFMANNNIRRDEVAAMFARAYKAMISKTVPVMPASCQFSDLGRAHSDLTGIVAESCALWLFKGSQGRFMPTNSITNAQALTVLVRMINGMEPEEWGTHWAQAYYLTAKYAWLTQGIAADSMTNLNRAITRGDIAKLIEAASVYLAAKQAANLDATQELVYENGSFVVKTKRTDRMK